MRCGCTIALGERVEPGNKRKIMGLCLPMHGESFACEKEKIRKIPKAIMLLKVKGQNACPS